MPKIAPQQCAVCSGSLGRGSFEGYLCCKECRHQQLMAVTAGIGVVTNQRVSTDINKRPTLLQQEQMFILQRVVRKVSSIIDFGCGDAGFLDACRNRFGEITLVGVEVDEKSVVQAMRRPGIRVFASVNGIDSALVDVDVVVAWHSFEHVPIDDLREIISGLRARIKPGGRLIVAVPNGSSLQARLFRSHWTYHDNPHHVSIFSRGSLDQVLMSCGFERTAYHRMWLYDGFSAFQSGLNVLTRRHNEFYELSKRGSGAFTWQSLLRLICASPVASVFLILALVNLRRGAGASLNVEYRAV